MQKSTKKPVIAVCLTSLGTSQKTYEGIGKSIAILKKYFEVIVDSRVVANDVFGSRSVQDRIDSINWAFENGDIVMAWDGGFNAVELLSRISDIRTRPAKLFVGYSDNTVLVNAFAAGKKCRTAYGPCLEDFLSNPKYEAQYTDSLLATYGSQAKLSPKKVKVLKEGTMSGKIWGGNNYSFDLLPGTAFCPKFNEPFILFMEGEDILKDKDYVWRDFIRNIDAVMLLPGAREYMQGLVIGSFPDSYKLKPKDVKYFLNNREYLNTKPVVIDYPCGHNKNSSYLPFGMDVEIIANSNTLSLKLLTNRKSI